MLGVTFMCLYILAPSRLLAEPPPTPEPPAEAPPSEPPPAGYGMSKEEARAAQSKAAQLFRENRFIEAAELLQLTYQSDRRAILLFNAGQAYRKAERAVEAKVMYEHFLAAAPESPLAGEARGYIKDMEALSAAHQRTQQIAFALEEQLEELKSREKQAALLLEQERIATLRTQQALTQTRLQLEGERHKPVYKRPWFWSVMTAVAVGAIAASAAGGYVGSRASTDRGTVVIEK